MHSSYYHIIIVPLSLTLEANETFLSGSGSGSGELGETKDTKHDGKQILLPLIVCIVIFIMCLVACGISIVVACGYRKCICYRVRIKCLELCSRTSNDEANSTYHKTSMLGSD